MVRIDTGHYRQAYNGKIIEIKSRFNKNNHRIEWFFSIDGTKSNTPFMLMREALQDAKLLIDKSTKK